VWEQNRSKSKNKNIWNSLAVVIHTYKGNAAGNSEKVVHPWLRRKLCYANKNVGKHFLVQQVVLCYLVQKSQNNYFKATKYTKVSSIVDIALLRQKRVAHWITPVQTNIYGRHRNVKCQNLKKSRKENRY